MTHVQQLPVVPLQAVFLPDPVLPARGRLAFYDLSGAPPQPEALAALGVFTREPARARLALPGHDGLPAVSDVPVALVDLEDALAALATLDGRVKATDSVHAWAQAARLANSLVTARALVPALVRRAPAGAGSGAEPGVVAQWRVDTQDPAVAEARRQVAATLPPAGHALVRPPEGGGERIWRAESLLGAFLDAVADLAIRRGGDPPRPGRPRARLLPWTARWAEALIDPEDPSVPLRDDADELVAGVTAWWRGQFEEGPGGSLELRLAAPAAQDGVWRLRLGVRTDNGVHVPAAEVWSGASSEPGDGVQGSSDTGLQQALLRGLARASRLFAPLDDVLDGAAPEGLDLDLEQAWTFLDQAADRLLLDGIGVVLPPELAGSDLVLRLRLGEDGAAAGVPDAPGIAPPDATTPDDGERGDDGERWDDGEAWDQEAAALELDGLAGLPGIRPDGVDPGAVPGPFGGLLAGFRWEAALGDEALNPEEFRALVQAKAPLVRLRERWVRIDPERLRRLERLGPPGELPLADALALGLAGSAAGAAELGLAPDGKEEPAEPVEVAVSGGLGELIDRLRAAAERPPVEAAPPGFDGELRPYQRRGVAWLQGMGELGLGAVLADEMGLGKTPTLIAHLLLRDGGAGPHLVVCPTSVVGNWEREFSRFAPTVTVSRHHGADRADRLDGLKGVLLTTYGTLRRDAELLASVEWGVITLDEAQQVKNPGTVGARAVRRLRSHQTVALTGTPLENRLAELWSLLDATNPGLLGSRAGFARRFTAPIEQRQDAEVARRLRRLVGPFILRREKRDPGILADLPEKIERTVVCPLTPEQAALYQAAVDRVLGGRRTDTSDAPGALRGATAFQRRGRILALLTELKQICNHPAQYLHERGPVPPGRGPAAAAPPRDLGGRSGKLAVACEIVAEAVGGGAQLLCFTQFVEMGRLLVAKLSADLGADVPFLHGAVPATQRDRMVAAFQGEPEALAKMGLDAPPPVLVVSLRAGGTGLSLTAATHVVHYDRWWNPAVEDQATDRAHRIGQSQVVEVHKLVTAGTVEERVAEVLERKRALAEQVVGTGDTWVTELGDDDLDELVALGADAPVTDLEEEPDWWEPS